ncbi:hypothetical protein ABPG75_007262 [Micractinium tetrahymenae]
MLHSSCALCSQPAAAAANLGPLLGPIRDAKNPAADELYVHRLCALWSPEVFETDHGTLRNVLAAIKRGRLMKCSHCGRRGATLGCRVPSCTCSYHVACARDAGCTYYCEQFQVACPDHAPLFRAEARQQIRRTPFTPYRQAAAAAGAAAAGAGSEDAAAAAAAAAAGGPEATPGGLEEGAELPSPAELPTFVRRKRGRRQRELKEQILAARAAMKRARRDMEQRRRQEAESSDDDEHFAKKEAARLARDTAKLNPITLMGDGSAVQHIFVKSPAPGKGQGQHMDRGAAAGAGQALPGGGPRAQQAHSLLQQQQQPTVETAAVGSIAATDFSLVAGLDDVVRQLREMVLLPMQYPALFEGMGLRPPRGILFHGVPGTGKTLAARALAGACAKHSPLPVTFFARKGADCLGKFHGEAERTLRLLFEEAGRRAPAIIFLDELDALVPARAARAGGSDQIYASVVSTLLTLMDGVTDRGSVIVIGATNRPEAIDPALRRPGRFDREVYFGLPTPAQRLAILKVHTQRWACAPPEALLRQVAARTEGYAGADLQSLCTAAVMAAVRRSAPLLLELAEQEAEAVAAEAGPGPSAGPGAAPVAASAEVAARPLQLQPAAAAAQPQGDQQQAAAQQDERQRRRQQLLDRIEVQASDWREALAAAPPPCSRRHGLSALAAGAATPLQQQELPLVSEPLQRLLAALHAADLPLPPPAAAAARAAAAASQAGAQPAAAAAAAGGAGSNMQQPSDQSSTQLEPVLLEHGALLPAPSAAAPPAAVGSPAGAPAASSKDRRAARLERQGEEDERLDRLGRSYAPCRLLLWGEGEQGQEAAAGAVLKLFDGCPVHCLSLPSLVAEGGDDAAAGCVALVGEALRRASPHTPCVFYLPRLESWALSKAHMEPEEAAERGFGTASPDGGGGNGEDGAEPPSSRRGGLVSPSFAGRWASPVGASPVHRGFPVAPSPFSGLLPLDERVGHTPAVARALRSVTQLHRQQQQQQQLPAQQAEQGRHQADEEGPTLGDLQRRASSLEPWSSGRPPRPSPLAPLLAPPAGLLPIRTSTSPGQALAAQRQGPQGQQQQQQAAGSPAVASAGVQQGSAPAAAAAAGTSAEAEAGAEEAGEEAETETEVEVACLSQAWSMFEALMRQVPATQPILVLATCHAAPDATPANLVRFFAGPPAVAAAAAVVGAEGTQRPAALPDAAAVAAPGVVRMQAPGAAAWQRAAAAAAEQVAAAVSHQAALLLHQQLAAAMEAADSRAKGPASSPAARAATPPQQQEQPPAGASPAGRRRAQQAQQAQQAAQQQCNTAELEQGLRLFDRLLAFQQQMAAALARERVVPLHRWVRDAAAGGGRRRTGPGSVPTFADIAQRCRAGEYDSVDALQADAAAAAEAVRGLAEEAQRAEQARQAKRGRQAEQPSPERWQDAQAAETEACALQDKIDAACFSLRQELQLSESSNAQLLAAAAAHVRRLQREHRERQEAEAARRRQDAEAQEAATKQRQGAAEIQQQQQEEAEAQEAAAGQQQHQVAEVDEQQAEPLAGGAWQGGERQGQGPAGAMDIEAAPAADGDREAQQPTVQQPQQQPRQGAPSEAAADAGAAADAAHAAQQEAVATATDVAAEQRRQQQQLACQACLHLRQRLAAELRPAVQRRLPSAPAAEAGTAWQVLQESAGRLSAAAAAAACNDVITAAVGAAQVGEVPPELVAALMAGDAVALQHCTTHLAVSCVVAFNVATNTDRRGA